MTARHILTVFAACACVGFVASGCTVLNAFDEVNQQENSIGGSGGTAGSSGGAGNSGSAGTGGSSGSAGSAGSAGTAGEGGTGGGSSRTSALLVATAPTDGDAALLVVDPLTGKTLSQQPWNVVGAAFEDRRRYWFLFVDTAAGESGGGGAGGTGGTGGTAGVSGTGAAGAGAAGGAGAASGGGVAGTGGTGAGAASGTGGTGGTVADNVDVYVVTLDPGLGTLQTLQSHSLPRPLHPEAIVSLRSKLLYVAASEDGQGGEELIVIDTDEPSDLKIAAREATGPIEAFIRWPSESAVGGAATLIGATDCTGSCAIPLERLEVADNDVLTRSSARAAGYVTSADVGVAGTRDATFTLLAFADGNVWRYKPGTNNKQGVPVPFESNGESPTGAEYDYCENTTIIAQPGRLSAVSMSSTQLNRVSIVAAASELAFDAATARIYTYGGTSPIAAWALSRQAGAPSITRQRSADGWESPKELNVAAIYVEPHLECP